MVSTSTELVLICTQLDHVSQAMLIARYAQCSKKEVREVFFLSRVLISFRPRLKTEAMPVKKNRNKNSVPGGAIGFHGDLFQERLLVSNI